MNIENTSWKAGQSGDFQGWLVTQRWYGDKSRSIVRAAERLIGEYPLPRGGSCRLNQLQLDFDDGGSTTYFVPTIARDGPEPVDAFSDPGFLDWLGEGFVEDRELDTAPAIGARLVWKRPENGSVPGWADQSPRVLEGEQSNTSVIFGSAAIVKVFRKLQPGINPDSEIVAFLTARGTFQYSPTYLGSIELRLMDDSESIELAAVQAYVPNEGDCWRWLPGALGAASDADAEAILEAIGLLGQRTGELHVALSDAGHDEAFRPVQIDAGEASALEERLGREVRMTTSMLHRQGACSYIESEELAGALLAGVSHVSALLNSFKTRVHGDYHLGQVLRSAGDFVIIDFEGEPSRSISERRQHHSPLKDVAGMIRSMDYAVATASQTSEPPRMSSLRAWGRRAEQAFLDGYLPAVRQSPRMIVPAEPDAFRQGLDLYTIEKALYEVRYELDNRPDWIDIPLGALRRIGGND